MKVRMLAVAGMVVSVAACAGDPAGSEWANAPTPMLGAPSAPVRGEARAATIRSGIASTGAGGFYDPPPPDGRGDDRSTVAIIRNPPPPPDPPIRATGEDRSTVAIVRNPPPPPPPDPIRGGSRR